MDMDTEHDEIPKVSQFEAMLIIAVMRAAGGAVPALATCTVCRGGVLAITEDDGTYVVVARIVEELEA